MRNIVSPLSGIVSPFGLRDGGALSVYAVVGLEPPLVLDFDATYYRTGGTATDLVSAATHTRASSATYVDADGILQTAAINEPRVGHHIWNGSAWVNEGYFHESEARTNLVTYSNDFTQWTASNAPTLTTGQADPAGGDTATKLDLDVNAGIFTFLGNLSGTFTDSIWVRGDTSGTITLSDASGGQFYIPVNVTTEWTRVNTGSHVLSGNFSMYLFRGTSDLSTVFIYGAQVEAGSTPSSYIPTSGSTFTRAADTLAEVTPLWGSALSINVKGTETFADEDSATQKLIYDRRVDAGNRITLALDTAGANTGKLTLTIMNGGTSATISTTADLTPNINEPFNVAFTCAANELGIALNGTAETRVSHALGLPDLSAVVATFKGMGTRSLIREWSDDLTDEGLEEASTNA